MFGIPKMFTIKTHGIKTVVYIVKQEVKGNVESNLNWTVRLH
jgi:hypothetical protein